MKLKAIYPVMIYTAMLAVNVYNLMMNVLQLVIFQKMMRM